MTSGSDSRKNSSAESAFEHLVAALKHVFAALVVTCAPVRRLVASRSGLERIRRGAVGRRRPASVTAVLSAPITAALIAPLVAATVGYGRIERWVVGGAHSPGQWLGGILPGTAPRAIGIVGIGVLVAVAAAVAARNSGLGPTIAVAMGPIFGVGLARYGTTVEHFSPNKFHRFFGATGLHFEAVGPVATVQTALYLAVLWGVPIGVLGFALGTVGRRLSRLFGGRRGGNGISRAEFR